MTTDIDLALDITTAAHDHISAVQSVETMNEGGLHPVPAEPLVHRAVATLALTDITKGDQDITQTVVEQDAMGAAHSAVMIAAVAGHRPPVPGATEETTAEAGPVIVIRRQVLVSSINANSTVL